MVTVTSEDIDRLYNRLDKGAEAGGYHLNPDVKFTKELVKGLLENERRYGYWVCPCRLAEGNRQEDLDIICPCDYRDPDLSRYNTCFCGLYVSQDVVDGKKKVGSIPERRPIDKKERAQFQKASKKSRGIERLPYPVWRCRVCGYLCARDEPPEICPVCKVKKDRFEMFIDNK
jgi:ferredoxin-thioredoxin reductase catalytic subunit